MVNHSSEPQCDLCGKILSSRKFLKTLRIENKKTFLCSSCYIKRRKEKRKELIEEDQELKQDLNKLKCKIDKERGYSRKSYEKRILKEKGYIPSKNKPTIQNYIPKRYKKDRESQGIIDSPIKIKGSKKQEKEKYYSILTLQEQRDILRILMSHGHSFEEAKESIRNLKEQLKITRNGIKNKQEELKLSKEKLLQELWKK
jgi:hypothetical protein